MKRLQILFFAFAFALCLHAQGDNGPQQFSPDKFDAELREFITNEAKLTEHEAAKFFPIYKEMQAKQRVVYGRQGSLVMSKPEGEKACLDAIRQRDENDLEMKRIQKAYHEKFLKILPASKVYAILRAEVMFHRRMLRRGDPNRRPGMGQNMNPNQNPNQNPWINHSWRKKK
jgi:hypothetical protein